MPGMNGAMMIEKFKTKSAYPALVIGRLGLGKSLEGEDAVSSFSHRTDRQCVEI